MARRYRSIALFAFGLAAVAFAHPYLAALAEEKETATSPAKLDAKAVDTKAVDTKAVDTKAVDTKAVDSKKLDPKVLTFFEKRIRPVLAEHCYDCHGEDEQEGGLRLDSRAGLISGGESFGRAVEPGKPDNSILINAINHRELTMPPEEKLTQDQIDDLTRWVQMGAPWPGIDADTLIATRKEKREITDEDRAWWSFQPITRPEVPLLSEDALTGNPIDAFIRSKLLEAGLQPSHQAGKRELIRRATFDLHGLPPTPEEVEEFVADERSDAYERLIDRLLASPHYGERWGRHWLDLVRYAQTNGYERDDEKPFAWRYRDYVIRAFNEDKPFSTFITEQLAGDELEEVTDDSVIATAFYRFGVWDDEPDDISQAVFDGYDDMLSTTSSAFLGLSIGCARCHEHKFDPITHEDYYRMLAFIRNVNYYLKPEGEQRNVVVVPLPGGGETLGVTERSNEPRPTHILMRGRVAMPGDEVQPGIPEVFCDPEMPTTPTISETRGGSDKSTGRRLALARWIASDENPLTARVLANRLWHFHFGRGIVTTPSDFGKTGIPPTHPELLDYLASELMDGNWQLKPLHKQIMMSATYRQSSRAENSQAVAADPDNQSLWRQNTHRLEAEAIRDAILAVSGQLNLEAGGRGFYPILPSQVIGSQSMPGRGWAHSDLREQNRRSIYVYSKRSLQLPLLEVFDVAGTEGSTAARARTTVAPQALTLLNSDFISKQADAFSQRLKAEAGPDPSAQIRRGYHLAVGRMPTDAEMEIARNYYERQLERFENASEGYHLVPGLPAALHKTFLDKCKPSDFFKDPMPDWSYHQGSWPGRGDGIHWVESERGPVAFSDRVALSDGTIRCQLMVDRNSQLATIVFRGKLDGDTWRGYELYFDPRNNRVKLQRVGNEVATLSEATVRLQPGHWHDIRITTAGPRIRAWLDNELLLDAVDEQPPLAGDRVGLRTGGAPLAFRDFLVKGKYQVVEITGNAFPVAEQRAMAAVTKLILNLNEFVYID